MNLARAHTGSGFRDSNTALSETITPKLRTIMFAIMISQENWPKILESTNFTEKEKTAFESYFLRHTCRKWIFLRGFVSDAGKFHDWTIIPEYVLMTDFDYDRDKIQHDWDQIVRYQ